MPEIVPLSQGESYDGVALQSAPGVDKPRIVEVGFEAIYLDELADRIGLRRAIDILLGGGDINALLVLSEAEVNALRSVFETGEAQSILEGGVLTVMDTLVKARTEELETKNRNSKVFRPSCRSTSRHRSIRQFSPANRASRSLPSARSSWSSSRTSSASPIPPTTWNPKS